MISTASQCKPCLSLHLLPIVAGLGESQSSHTLGIRLQWGGFAQCRPHSLVITKWQGIVKTNGDIGDAVDDLSLIIILVDNPKPSTRLWVIGIRPLTD